MTAMSDVPRKEKIDLSHEVGQLVQIEGGNVLRAAMMRAREPHGPARVEIAFNVSHELLTEAKKLNVTVELRLHGKELEEGAPTVVSIETTYVATYRLRALESLTREHFQAFAEMNGIYNIWPFWREFVQNAISRMGIPGFTLPVIPPITKQISNTLKKQTGMPPGRSGVTGVSPDH